MKEEIYLDVYFFVNALMNLIVLHLSGRLLHTEYKIHRLLLASAFGGVYACGSLFLKMRVGWRVGLWFLCLLLMGTIAFGFLAPKKMLSVATTSLLFSFLLGGLMEGMSRILLNTEQKLGLSFVAFVAVFGTAWIRYCSEQAREKLKECKVTVRVKAFEKEYEWRGFCDSGNLVKEPISGLPVILLGSCVIKDDSLRPYFTGEFNSREGVYPIPIKTACSSGLIFAFRPQETTILTESKVFKVESVLIGATAKCESFSDCECLIPCSLL